ncbi:MAG: GNAT family N-acetyltransferase [Actinomycetota bacterium]|nr:GNAT family N-acetyltransferase [Actinomycetota bacterium]
MERTPSPQPRFSERFLLRPFRRRDVDPLLEAVLSSLPELHQWLPWAHMGYGRTDAAGFVRDSMRSWQEGRAFDFAVRRTSEPDRHIGNVSVWYVSHSYRSAEIGYWVRSDETGQNVATEASKAALQVIFEELRMHRAVLRIAEGNRGSERVAEKLGFTREGLLREEIRVRGAWLDHSVWGLLEHEYRRRLQASEVRRRFPAQA